MAMISREQYLNRYSLITKLFGQRIFHAKTNIFCRRTNNSFQEGGNLFLAYDDITQKLWRQYNLLFIFSRYMSIPNNTSNLLDKYK